MAQGSKAPLLVLVIGILVIAVIGTWSVLTNSGARVINDDATMKARVNTNTAFVLSSDSTGKAVVNVGRQTPRPAPRAAPNQIRRARR